MTQKELHPDDVDFGQGYGPGEVDFGDVKSSTAPPASAATMVKQPIPSTFMGGPPGMAMPMPTPPWLAETIGNIPASAARLAEGFMHPIEGAKSLGKTALGVVEAMTPEQYRVRTEEMPYASAAADYFKNRYGSLDAIVNTIKTDPVGAMADASALMGGGGAALRGAGAITKIPKLAEVGEAMRTAGSMTDPVQLGLRAARPVTRPISTLAKEVLGVTTTKGPSNVGEAFSSENAKAFTDALHGRTSPEAVRDAVIDKLSMVKDERKANYQQQYANLVAQQGGQQIPMAPIQQALGDQLTRFKITQRGVGTNLISFKGSTITNAGEITRIRKAYNDILEWSSDPAQQTFEGLDTLKQRLSGYAKPIGKGDRATAFVNALIDAADTTLTQAVPGYADMTASYAEASKFIREVQGELSVGPRSRTGAGITKLLGALNANNPHRATLLEALDKYGTPELKSQVAGLAMRPWAPAGMMRTVVAGRIVLSALTGTLGPDYMLELLSTSPRLVGEAGVATQKLKPFAQTVSKAEIYRPVTAAYDWSPEKGLVPHEEAK